jgi:hypothetical protein
MWRVGYIEVDMIFADSPLNDLNFIRIAYLTNQFAYPKTYFFGQDVVPIFGNPDQVNLEVMNRM